MSNKERDRMWRLGARYMSVGIEMAVALSVGTFGGRWLDGVFHTEPILLWVGIGAGMGACAKTIHRIVKNVRRDGL